MPPQVVSVDDDPYVEPVDYDPFEDPHIVELVKTAEEIRDALESQRQEAARNHAQMLAALERMTGGLEKVAVAVSKPRRVVLKRNADGSASEAISE